MRGLVIGAALAAGIGLLGAVGTAWAQDAQGNIPHVTDRLKISAGGMLATSKDLRDDGADGWFLVDVGFDLQHPSSTRLVDFNVFFDAAFNSQSNDIDKGNYNNAYHTHMRSFYGFGVAARVHLTPQSKRFSVYGTGGVGIYSLGQNESDSFEYDTYQDYDPETGQYTGDTTGTYTRDEYSRHKYQLGYKFGLGFSFGRGLFVESDYMNLGKLADVRYSGISLTIGARL